MSIHLHQVFGNRRPGGDVGRCTLADRDIVFDHSNPRIVWNFRNNVCVSVQYSNYLRFAIDVLENILDRAAKEHLISRREKDA